MAIQKTINYRAGIDLSYWMITKAEYNKTQDLWEVKLGGYISQETRQIELRKPMMVKSYQFQNNLPFTKSVEEIYTELYKLIMLKSEFKNSKFI